MNRLFWWFRGIGGQFWLYSGFGVSQMPGMRHRKSHFDGILLQQTYHFYQDIKTSAPQHYPSHRLALQLLQIEIGLSWDINNKSLIRFIVIISQLNMKAQISTCYTLAPKFQPISFPQRHNDQNQLICPHSASQPNGAQLTSISDACSGHQLKTRVPLELGEQQGLCRSCQIPPKIPKPTSLAALEFLNKNTRFNKREGIFIVDQQFRLLYADKLGRQLLSADAYILRQKNFMEYVYSEGRQNFVENCQQSLSNRCFKFQYLIYNHREVKKRWKQPELQNPTKLDFYCRYLKALKSKVVEIYIDFNGYENHPKQIFINSSLINPGHLTHCFAFKTSSTKIPNLRKYNFKEDSTIMKIQARVAAKKIKKFGKDYRKIQNQPQQENSMEIEEKPQKEEKCIPKTPPKTPRKTQRKSVQQTNIADEDEPIGEQPIKTTAKPQRTIQKTKDPIPTPKSPAEPILEPAKQPPIRTPQQPNNSPNCPIYPIYPIYPQFPNFHETPIEQPQPQQPTLNPKTYNINININYYLNISQPEMETFEDMFMSKDTYQSKTLQVDYYNDWAWDNKFWDIGEVLVSFYPGKELE